MLNLKMSIKVYKDKVETKNTVKITSFELKRFIYIRKYFFNSL